VFKKVLIANRGEIAVRIVRACRELGIATVAVYSEVDRGALHVRLADEAFPCGPARASESYLAGEKLLRIAERAGAEAVHPGYGFLSENGDFAQACADRGFVFIGPAPEVLRAMGDKVTSRRIVSAAGVPVVPGSSEARGDREIAADALELGLPVIVKASGGGGGRGMRIVREAADLADALASAAREAEGAFGSAHVFLEKLVEPARYVEIQIIADSHGNVVHLGERECSIQRRHQKIVEESPSPRVDPELRAAMGEAALRLARELGYRSAGTVEFLVDSDGSFYFIEMNTRIQVEHPVTEVTTGLDLVKEQIRVAAGEPLSFPDEIPHVRGHAIEFRVNAEDALRNFAPCPGPITTFHPPGGPGVRLDTHLYSGYQVPPYYDSLLAKLIVSGKDREETIVRARHALESFVIEGIQTTIPFLAEITRNEKFVAGGVDTGFVDDFLSERSTDR